MTTRLLQLFDGWACEAEGSTTRRAHMASLTRAKSQAHLLSCKAGAQGAGAAVGATSAARISNTSGSSSSTSTSSTSSDSESSSERGAGGGRPRPEVGGGPPVCWVCDGAHRTEHCHIWRAARDASLLEAGAFGVGRVQGSDAVMLAPKSVAIKDVPSDGNCLFHALQRELRADPGTGRPGLLQPGMDRGTDGQALREWLLQHIQTIPDEMEGQPLQTWLGMPREQYMEEMRVPRGRETWGGYLEVCLISKALGVSVLMLTTRAAGHHVTAWTSPDLHDVRRTVAVIWTGAHWQRARLSREAWENLRLSWRG